jgi:hypothetical protein
MTHKTTEQASRLSFTDFYHFKIVALGDERPALGGHC